MHYRCYAHRIIIRFDPLEKTFAYVVKFHGECIAADSAPSLPEAQAQADREALENFLALPKRDRQQTKPH